MKISPFDASESGKFLCVHAICSEHETNSIQSDTPRSTWMRAFQLPSSQISIVADVLSSAGAYREALVRCAKGGNPAAQENACEAVKNLRKRVDPRTELSSIAVDCIRSSSKTRLLRLCA